MSKKYPTYELKRFICKKCGTSGLITEKDNVKVLNGFWCLKVKNKYRDEANIEEKTFSFINKSDALKAQELIIWITKSFTEELFCTSEIDTVFQKKPVYTIKNST